MSLRPRLRNADEVWMKALHGSLLMHISKQKPWSGNIMPAAVRMVGLTACLVVFLLTSSCKILSAASSHFLTSEL